MLNEINLYPNTHLNKFILKYNSNFKPLTAHTRSFSSSSKFKSDDNSEPDLVNLTYMSDQSLCFMFIFIYFSLF